MLAAAISFYFLLSFVPLTLLGLSIAGMLMGAPQKAAAIILTLTNLQELLPEGAVHVGSFFHNFVEHAWLVSKVSLVLLFFFSAGVFLTIEAAINRVFERHENRPFWRQLVFAYILMILTYLALVGSSAATWGAMLISDLGINILGLSRESLTLFWRWFLSIAPIVWVSIYFGINYEIIPHRHIPWRYALVGGLFAGIGWDIAKRLFTLYITHVVKFNELYGGVSTLLATFMWVFYTAAIMLLGGELTMSLIKGRRN